MHYDGSGYWLATKRLSQDRYRGWPVVDQALSNVDASTLMALIKSSTCQETMNRID
ncbi:MAG: transposase [Gammaproteobacteria bacterium]|nr:transposase [Gammaproteobacteria bacterium]